jgi:hypothetical protein
MLTEITTAISALNNVKELAKAILQLNVSAALKEQAIETQSAIIEVQSGMLAIQSQYQSLLEEKDGLKKQLIEMENWESEAQNYALTEIGYHAFAYSLKPDVETASPSHWLCANCYQAKKKSILQRDGNKLGRPLYVCHLCKSNLVIQ